MINNAFYFDTNISIRTQVYIEVVGATVSRRAPHSLLSSHRQRLSERNEWIFIIIITTIHLSDCPHIPKGVMYKWWRVFIIMTNLPNTHFTPKLNELWFIIIWLCSIFTMYCIVTVRSSEKPYFYSYSSGTLYNAWRQIWKRMKYWNLSWFCFYNLFFF